MRHLLLVVTVNPQKCRPASDRRNRQVTTLSAQLLQRTFEHDLSGMVTKIFS